MVVDRCIRKFVPTLLTVLIAQTTLATPEAFRPIDSTVTVTADDAAPVLPSGSNWRHLTWGEGQRSGDGQARQARSDCNDNGIPDECDLTCAGDCGSYPGCGQSEDSNLNGLPDECDIAGLEPLAYWRLEGSGEVVVDSGPNGLDGALNAWPLRSPEVPVDPVPALNLANTQALDLNWQSTSSGGFFTVPDVDLALTLGNQNFTIEAWVKLDYLSGTGSNDERQYLCQKKPLPSWDEVLDYAFLVQRGNNGNPNPNYGKTGGFTGRELQLIFGTNNPDARTWGITSNLEINDYNWHFVSVAYDTYSGVVRFGIDGTFETVPFFDNPKVINDGPLRVGSHQNYEGVNNQYLRGLIDELRITRRFLPPEHLLNAPMLDCNGNSTPDLLDISNGTSADCNGNLIPDECDIADEMSEDCQPDGIPDECQLAESVDLFYDHGFAQIAWRADEPYMAWLNRFNVEDGAGTVDAIDVLFGIMPIGTQVGVYVWSDPDGDGDPTDAQVLWSSTATVQQTDVLSRIDVPEVVVGDTGASFFLGFTVSVTADDFPGALDIYGVPVPARSWGVGSNSPIDPNDLAAGAVEFGTIDELLFGGDWVIRAHMINTANDCNANGEPDDCDITAGSSDDVDGNGIPDECEDCNDNGIVDGFDIAGGTSEDCNADGVPDECQTSANDCDDDGVPDDCQVDLADCNGNGILDACDMASGFSEDIDLSGVPDECEDCNGNSVVDSIDIGMGTSDDCNEDGVPDECQFGEPSTTLEYVYDDGSKESNLNFVGAVLDLAWMHRYTVQPGGEWVAAIELVWGDTYPGMPAEVVLWTDPDGDGNPTDAQVIRTVDTMTMNVNTIIPIWNTIPIPPTYIGSAGTSFFVGVHFDDIYQSAPIALDVDDADGQGWVAYAPSGTLDLSDLAGYGLMAWPPHDFFIRAVGFDGLLEYDCNENEVLDVCDISSGGSADVNGNGVPDECEAWIPGDLDGDGYVDLEDFVIFEDCMSGPDVPYVLGCSAADLTSDGDVDLIDWSAFQTLFSGT